jgi:hypothetical protein
MEELLPPPPPPIPRVNNTCYIVMRTHGNIDWDTIIPVPIGKEIIKKNRAACGYIALSGKSVTTERYDLVPYVNEMRTNMSCMLPQSNMITRHIATADYDPYDDPIDYLPYTNSLMSRNRYHRYVSKKPDSGYPIMNDDPNAEVCQVMIGKTQYYNKQYITIPGGTGKQHQHGGVFIYIWNSIDYDIFNISSPVELNRLLEKYYGPLNNFARLPPALVELLERIDNLYLVSSESITHFMGLDTRFLFKLYSLLPFNIFKILDLACAAPNDPMDPRRFTFDYLGDTGYGIFKKNKKVTKKQLQKYIKKTRFRKKGKRINKNIGV